MMHCYSTHRTIISVMKIMKLMENIVCIHPSHVLIGICQELHLSEPVYSEISREQFKFQFSVHLTSVRCQLMETDDNFSATGYSFRDKSDAIESAAMSALDALMYQHGIRSHLYSNLAFINEWPAYDHISKNLKSTCSALMDIGSVLSSLIDHIDDHRTLFEVGMLNLNNGAGNSTEVDGLANLSAVFNDCYTELQSTHQVLFSGTTEHSEALQWRCQSHRFYKRGGYEAAYSLHKDLDVKQECISTLKMTLTKVCERGGYSLGAQSSECVSEGFYMAKILLVKISSNAKLENTLCVKSANCKSIYECQQDAIFRAINVICSKEGIKIVDAGYLALRNMRKERQEFKHEVPLLCNIVAKMKSIIKVGFNNINVLSQRYYRRLRDPKVCAKLRLGLADCISDFIYIIESLDEEVKKMEIYSSQSPPLEGHS